MKVFLVGFCNLTSIGIRAILRREADVEIVGESNSIVDAEVLIGKNRPDLVLADADFMSVSTGQLTNLLKRFPSCRFIAIAELYSWPDVTDFMASGGVGFLPKSISGQEFVQAIRHIYSRGAYVSPTLRNPRKDDKTIGDKSLTKREHEVLLLIATGYTNKEIAEQLCISKRTVDLHRMHIRQKLGLKSRAQLASYVEKLQRIRKEMEAVDPKYATPLGLDKEEFQVSTR